MKDEHWEVLIDRIKRGNCTPFLGAGVNHDILPTGAGIAGEWAAAHNYPLTASHELERVAQFVATTHDARWPKTKIIERLRRDPRPDFRSDDPRLTCLKALAALPLPVFITTNYDNLMYQALLHSSQRKEPFQDHCRWYEKKKPKAKLSQVPTVSHPLVYHLHGREEFEHSIVLTEDDYMDFLVNLSSDFDLLPPKIHASFTDATLLFIGYSLRDIDFRVIHRGLVQGIFESRSSLSVAVQMTPPSGSAQGKESDAQKFLEEYFASRKVRVFWGTATEFAEALQSRLEASK